MVQLDGLIGRRSELTGLEECLSAAVDGRGSLYLVAGSGVFRIFSNRLIIPSATVPVFQAFTSCTPTCGPGQGSVNQFIPASGFVNAG